MNISCIGSKTQIRALGSWTQIRALGSWTRIRMMLHLSVLSLDSSIITEKNLDIHEVFSQDSIGANDFVKIASLLVCPHANFLATFESGNMLKHDLDEQDLANSI